MYYSLCRVYAVRCVSNCRVRDCSHYLRCFVLYLGDKHTMDSLQGTSTGIFDYTETDEVSVMENCPRGFVGWFKGAKLKLWVANVSEDLVECMYEKSMRDVAVERLQLVPKEPEQTLKSVFFSKSRGFREHFEHEYFTVLSTNTGMTPVELFNFLPAAQAKAMFHQESEVKARVNYRNRVLHDFVFAYKAFQSGEMGNKEEDGIGSDNRDVEKLIKFCLGFGPSFLKLYREVGILCSSDQCLPHGYLDMMMYSEKDKGIYVAIKDFEPGSLKDISQYPAMRLSVTSAKTSDCFYKRASDRQCCVELLAFSEVVRKQNKDVKFAVLIKACKTVFQLYVYFNKIDLLIRTSPITLVDTTKKAPNIMGMFAFFLSINHQINTLFHDAIKYTETMRCGWQEAYSGCGYDYFPFFAPCKFTKTTSGVKRAQPVTDKKGMKRIHYSSVDYDDC